MKSLILITLLVTTCIANAAKPIQKHSLCESIAVKVAVKDMDEAYSEGFTDQNGKPAPLGEAEKATVTQVDFLDKNGDIADVETGIYGVVMAVMEECLDGSIVTTKKQVDQCKESCELIEIKSYGDRDCG